MVTVVKFDDNRPDLTLELTPADMQRAKEKVLEHVNGTYTGWDYLADVINRIAEQHILPSWFVSFDITLDICFQIYMNRPTVVWVLCLWCFCATGHLLIRLLREA